jgi:hypothetical protein
VDPLEGSEHLRQSLRADTKHIGWGVARYKDCRALLYAMWSCGAGREGLAPKGLLFPVTSLPGRPKNPQAAPGPQRAVGQALGWQTG